MPPTSHHCSVLLIPFSSYLHHAGTIVGDLNRRKGMIMDSGTIGDDCVIQAEVPLNAMFGYSTVLRSNTQVSTGGWGQKGAGGGMLGKEGER